MNRALCRTRHFIDEAGQRKSTNSQKINKKIWMAVLKGASPAEQIADFYEELPAVIDEPVSTNQPGPKGAVGNAG